MMVYRNTWLRSQCHIYTLQPYQLWHNMSIQADCDDFTHELQMILQVNVGLPYQWPVAFLRLVNWPPMRWGDHSTKLLNEMICLKAFNTSKKLQMGTMQGWSVPNMAETVTWQKPQLQNMHFHKVFDNQEMKGPKHVCLLRIKRRVMGW